MIRTSFQGVVTPYYERTFQQWGSKRRPFKLSFGQGPAGYDVRVEFDSKGHQPCIVLAPGQFALASTVEKFSMPSDCLGIVHDKSTWARLGLTVQNTVIEPGWRGWLTLELHNQSQSLLRIWRGMAIAQVILHEIDTPVTYSGKFQDQPRGPHEGQTGIPVGKRKGGDS